MVFLFIAFFAVGYILPADWKVERSTFIKAKPQQIYPLIANFKTGWPQWSAFDFEDPSIQYSYSGPLEGVGATRSWVSQKMGDGSQTILWALPDSGIEFQLSMNNGFLLNGRIAFQDVGGETKVTWMDYGKVDPNPIHRYMASVMDKMMGSAFEKSLSTLKAKAESPSGPRTR